MSDTVEFKDYGLKKLIRALENVPSVHVGILGSKTHYTELKPGSGQPQALQTNADIGAIHEFGNPAAKPPRPVRSFLRMPLTNHLNEFLEKSGGFDEDSLKKVIQAGTLEIWMKKIGIVAEATIAQAFLTGGWGEWKQSDMRDKRVAMTLVETGQLRNSITSEVVP